MLLVDATFAVPVGRHVALVGRNGSGKSTLLETIGDLATRGAPPPHVELRGSLELGPGTRVASLPQSPQLTSTGAVAAYLDGHAGEASRAWRAHEELAAALAEREDPELLTRYGEALEAVQRLEAWDYPQRRADVLAGLGLGADVLHRPIASLSGGEATRVALAGVLLAPAELLLLDEPTNNLDLASLRFLTGWLRSSPAGVLVVSHDRDLLDEAVDEILEVEERTGRVLQYGGNFSLYEARKAEEFEAHLRAFEEQERRRARLEGSAARLTTSADRFQTLSQNDFYRRKGGKVAKLATAQRTRIDRELRGLGEPRPHMPPRFTVHPPHLTDGTLIRGQGLSFGFSAARLFKDVSITVAAGRRVMVVGPNGTGKTTLLRLLAGELPPAAGDVWRAPRLHAGWLRQVEQLAAGDGSLLEHAARLHPTPEEELRAILGKVVFADPSRLRTADVSEGERRRAECAALFASRPDLLLLDEPTNHLDLATIGMLEEALESFAGAVLAVSHDRRFLRRLEASVAVRFDGKGGVDVLRLATQHDLEQLL
jgi:ATPase subunit of ABC transporter with duplicated ATPase domains